MTDAPFNPRHAKEWKIFWDEICAKNQFYSCFPALPLLEAQRTWLDMERHLFGRYRFFLRVWPEWYSSGIWLPPYPGSRAAGGMVGYSQLDLPDSLIAEFEAWQSEYNESPPCGAIELDWQRFDETGLQLARKLKRSVGEDVYVEYRELHEVLIDGRTHSYWPLLGLPDPADPAAS